MKTKCKLSNRILSLVLALVLVIGMLPMTALTAYAAPSEAETITTNSSGKHTYSENLTVYYKYNDCLYKAVFSNLNNMNKVGLSVDHSQSLAISAGLRLATTAQSYSIAEASDLPTQEGSSVNLFLLANHNAQHNDENKPIIVVTCMAVGDPAWTWNGTSSATAVFTSTDGNATITVGANITSSTQGAASCLEKDQTIYTATATCNGQAYTTTKTVDGAAGPHSYTYSASGDTLTKTCSNNCSYSAKATLQRKSDADLTYTGSAIEPMEMVYPEGWAGEKKQPADTDYTNNVKAGTNTASCSFTYADGATVEKTFSIEPASLSECIVTITPASGTYTGSYHDTPTYTLKYNGNELVKDIDYIVVANWSGDFLNADSHNLLLEGKGNFAGYKTLTYNIGKATPSANLFQLTPPDNAVYDGTTAYSAEVKSNAVGMGIITVKYTDSEGKSVTAPKDAGNYNVLVDVTAGTNYTAIENLKVGTLTISQATPTITVAENQAVVYDGEAITAGASNADILYTYTGDGVVSVKWYDANGQYVDTNSSDLFVPKDAGTYMIGVSAAESDNYKAVEEVKKTITIEKRSVTVKADDASKTYGGTDPVLTWTVTSGSELASKPLSIHISRAEGENVGDYAITVSQTEAANPNYEISFVNGTFTINKAHLTVTAEDKTVTYGDAVPAYTVTYSGFAGSECEDDLGGALTFDCAYTPSSDKGEYTIIPSGLTSGNYEIAFVPGKLTVEPKPITVTIADKTSVYGEAVAELTATTDGIVNNDTDVYSLATTATSTANAGTYPITGTALDANYDITFVNGTYTITKAPVSSIGTDMTVSYSAGMEIDLRQMFSVDENAGTVDYWITHLTGEGSFTSEPYLYRIDKAGTFTVKITTEETANYNSGEATAVLTVKAGAPGIGTVTANVVENTLETSAIVLSRANTDIPGTLTVDAEQTLAWDDNTIRYTFTPDDTTNYEVVKGEVTVTVADTIAPTGTVAVSTKSWAEFLNNITFGLFFKETQTVSVTASDNLSGVAKIEYIESKTALDLDAVKAATQWTEMKNGSVSVTLEDTKQFIYYIRITDKAGNVAYLSTDGAEYDTTAPVIAGVDNGVTYYTTQKVTVTDKNIDAITLNGETATGMITLEGNKEAAYTIVATDKAGNSTTVTVTMAPISELAELLEGKTEENATSDDMSNLQAIVDTAQELLKDVDITAAEKAELEEAKIEAQKLLDAVNEAQTALDTETINEVVDITAETVKLENKTSLKTAIAELEQALEDYSGNYTQEEQMIIREKVGELAAAVEAIEKVETAEKAAVVLPETAQPDDETAIKSHADAKAAYEALSEHEKTLVSKDALAKLEALAAALTDYDIVKGDGSNWVNDSSDGLTLVANGAFSKFIGVLVDGKEVADKHYTAKSGSTIITFKAEYLKTLSSGKHTVTVCYNDGQTEGSIIIKNAPAATSSVTGTGDDTNTSKVPNTGDNADILLYGMLFTMSMAALIVLLVSKKRKQA